MKPLDEHILHELNGACRSVVQHIVAATDDAMDAADCNRVRELLRLLDDLDHAIAKRMPDDVVADHDTMAPDAAHHSRANAAALAGMQELRRAAEVQV